MRHLIETVYSSTRLLKLVSDTNDFEAWLMDTHSKSIDKQILEGYKFFVSCAFLDLFSSVAGSEHFPVRTDRLLQSAVGQAVFPVEKLPETCERIIFLKNIWRSYMKTQRSRSLKSFQNNLDTFKSLVLADFEKLVSVACSVNQQTGWSVSETDQRVLIGYLFIHYNQIFANGPVAYHGTLQKKYWIPKKQLLYCLEGYKYVLQYTWFKSLGETWYHSTSLKHLHKADSWNNYTYLPSNLPEDATDIERIIEGRHFDIEQQTSLDSYFWRIKSEIVDPMEQNGESPTWFEHHVSIDRDAVPKFQFREHFFQKSDRDYFGELTEDEKIDVTLYWMQYEVVETGAIYTGASAFITSLVGTVGLLNQPHREIDDVLVARFIHPAGEGKNTYSYGVLIDSMAAAGHYHSGWLIYHDCGNDFSGFGGAEHRKIEEYISRFQKKGSIEVRSLRVSEASFEEYLARYMQQSSLVESRDIKESKLELVKLSERTQDFIGKSKSLVFELMVYQALRRWYPSAIEVEWSINKKNGEIDILVVESDLVRVIECKLTPDNVDLLENHKTGLEKLKRLKGERNGRFEFWFWNPPSIENVKLLEKETISFYFFVGSEILPREFQGFDMSLFRKVLSFSETV